MSKNKKKSGQIALIVVLLMVVILTIGLSLISRSITDVRISQDEKEALRAFSAAEAGIEEVLKSSSLASGPVSVDVGDLVAEVTVEELADGVAQETQENENMSIFLDGSTASQVTLNWIDTTKGEETSEFASLEVVVYDKDYNLERYNYNATSRGNGFEPVSDQGVDNYYKQVSFNVDADDRLIRIKPLYNQATIMITTNTGDLATQQYRITSVVGQEGGKTSKVIVTRTAAVLPPVFDFTLFDGDGSLDMGT
jgi:hypothetical protein